MLHGPGFGHGTGGPEKASRMRFLTNAIHTVFGQRIPDKWPLGPTSVKASNARTGDLSVKRAPFLALG
jgi:hypothetical protein